MQPRNIFIINAEFGKQVLKLYTPCKKFGDVIANALVVVHVEVIIIHRLEKDLIEKHFNRIPKNII
ncbi:hypothetical protein [Legionella maceachernii]|uniref:Uncharacterized protein n=1 Tax=Legionella maceachernii TaxID=466 RepID=A0A0W0VZ19_9GAMM|nr:hypothetical protein [Legionella maceachernii]KTD25166.1 hypothetical protein Lmac_2144 [Legionella maceachernii]SJZ75131.1 hypothetical protein SAMN02745128_00936 [Legionella maceachernii]SUP03201.1 Uncharacterised protein [Legionella maceachernii]